MRNTPAAALRWPTAGAGMARTDASSWLRPPVLVDACYRTGHVRLAIEHVSAIHHDGRNLEDAKAPGVGNALVGGADPSLQVCTAQFQALLDDGAGALRIGGQVVGQLRFEHRGRVQDEVSVSLAKDRMMRVGNDPDFRSGGASGQRQNGDGRSNPCWASASGMRNSARVHGTTPEGSQSGGSRTETSPRRDKQCGDHLAP